MTNLTDSIRGALTGVLGRSRRGMDTEARLTGTQTTESGPVGGVWRGTMEAGDLRMRVLITLRNQPQPGAATWYATGVSDQAWKAAQYETNLGPVIIKTHSFNPSGHYYEIDGYGEVGHLEVDAVH
ncbi:MAG: hypothetical protein ACR2QM_15245 [Longimicrobiales bacterium]